MGLKDHKDLHFGNGTRLFLEPSPFALFPVSIKGKLYFEEHEYQFIFGPYIEPWFCGLSSMGREMRSKKMWPPWKDVRIGGILSGIRTNYELQDLINLFYCIIFIGVLSISGVKFNLSGSQYLEDFNSEYWYGVRMSKDFFVVWWASLFKALLALKPMNCCKNKGSRVGRGIQAAAFAIFWFCRFKLFVS